MNRYAFILESMRYSFSSLTSYETCPGGFKLSYIDCEDRINNAFSDYGNLVHNTLEMFFKGTLEQDQLSDHYKQNFSKSIVNNFPPFPQGMRESYYQSGLEFFENFEFDKSLYEIIFIEDYVNAVHKGKNIVVKPDLILKEKSTGKYILIDYKTARIKKTKKDKQKQIHEYKTQFLLYCYFLWMIKNIEVKEMHIWFIRDDEKMVIPVDPMEAQKTVEWAEETIDKILNEEEWEFKDTKENEYFCNQLCGVRLSCPKMNFK